MKRELNYSQSTGYFGIPGREGRSVHFVMNGKPICGTRLDSRSEYQWCCYGWNREYVECKRCNRKKI